MRTKRFGRRIQGMHPTKIRRYLSDEQFRMYQLIWQRFVASQMVPAIYDVTTIDIDAKNKKTYNFRVSGSVLKFDGYLKIYEQEEDDEEELPDIPQRRAADAGHAGTPYRALTAAGARGKDRPGPEENTTSKWPRSRLATKKQGPGDKSRRDSSIRGTADRDCVAAFGGACRAEVHRAAPALQRSIAGQGTGRTRHRTAVDVRVDHHDHSGSRICDEDPANGARAAASSRPRSARS
jgi:hypothetical protein